MDAKMKIVAYSKNVIFKFAINMTRNVFNIKKAQKVISSSLLNQIALFLGQNFRLFLGPFDQYLSHKVLSLYMLRNIVRSIGNDVLQRNSEQQDSVLKSNLELLKLQKQVTSRAMKIHIFVSVVL
jgi:hypothetical protein